MKPFNLEAALRGEAVVTRDKRPVTGLHLFKALHPGKNPLYGVLDSIVIRWCNNGRYTESCESNCDLFMAPKKRTVFVNFYHGTHSAYHPSKEDAMRFLSDSMKAIAVAVPVEIEE